MIPKKIPNYHRTVFVNFKTQRVVHFSGAAVGQFDAGRNSYGLVGSKVSSIG